MVRAQKGDIMDLIERGRLLDKEAWRVKPYDEMPKRAFHRKAKRYLDQLARDVLHLEKGQYDLGVMLGGIAVCGESYLHTDFLYVQIAAEGIFNNDARVLYRSCKSRKDSTSSAGGRNQWCRIQDLPKVLAPFAHPLVRECGVVL